jgi:hypothetical protein
VTWTTYTLVDAYKPRPPIEYIVDLLFEIPSLSIVYGAPGSMKSFILQDLSICVASGRQWLQPALKSTAKSFNVRPYPVLWVDQDNGIRRTHERFDALGVGHGKVDELTPIYYISMPNPWLNATKTSAMIVLRDTIRSTGARLVVIDNLGTILGGADENSTEMIDILSELRQLAEIEKIALVVIHHQRKTNGIKGRAGESLRGHSSIEAALDLALLVEREPRSKEIKVVSTKTRGVDVPTFGALFTFIHKSGSRELELAYFEGITIDDPKTPAGLKTIIISIVSKNPPSINQSNLIDEVKALVGNVVGRNRIRELIDELVQENELDTDQGQKNATLYFLP